MKDGSQKNHKEMELSPDAEFVPRAVRLSGSSITGMVISANVNGKDYYSMVSGPDFEPTGWVDMDSIIDTVVAKHRYIELAQDSGAPRLKPASLFGDMQKLSKWLVKNRLDL